MTDDEGVDESLWRVGLMDRMKMEITHLSADRVVGTMPVEGNTQPYGLLHGGASAALAETLGSFGANAHGAPHQVAVGVDLSVTHHRAVTDGYVTGVATPLHLGRTVCTYEIAITDSAGRSVATARLTCLLRDKPH